MQTKPGSAVNNRAQDGILPRMAAGRNQEIVGRIPWCARGRLAPLVELKPDPLAGRGARSRPGGLPHKFFAPRDETNI